MVDRIDKAMKGRRSLESALAELETKYRTRPSAELARMMEQLKAEITIRKRRPKPQAD
jgi:phosphotransferase system HPr-like phosphotransfer protein